MSISPDGEIRNGGATLFLATFLIFAGRVYEDHIILFRSINDIGDRHKQDRHKHDRIKE